MRILIALLCLTLLPAASVKAAYVGSMAIEHMLVCKKENIFAVVQTIEKAVLEGPDQATALTNLKTIVDGKMEGCVKYADIRVVAEGAKNIMIRAGEVAYEVMFAKRFGTEEEVFLISIGTLNFIHRDYTIKLSPM